jgi:uncharacterized YigZ family protein
MNVISREGRAEIEVRRSRFLGCSFRTTDPESAAGLLRRIRLESREASHHAWAWRIGPAAELARASDDGEPSGTAGPPLLNVLARREVTHVLLVVSRWFGGTKLGAGGLARAYGEAAKGAIEDSRIRPLRWMVAYRVEVPHPALPSFERYLAGQGFEVLGREFAEAAGLTIRLPADREEAFRSFYLSLVSGRGLCREVGRELA